KEMATFADLPAKEVEEPVEETEHAGEETASADEQVVGAVDAQGAKKVGDMTLEELRAALANN
ncbi:hypothetical protein BIFPSEUDO_04485, partial [Bifidobacterium pseudocatenulatum DSM 20438 = JCM 1200 = LMG 10505]